MIKDDKEKKNGCGLDDIDGETVKHLRLVDLGNYNFEIGEI